MMKSLGSRWADAERVMRAQGLSRSAREGAKVSFLMGAYEVAQMITETWENRPPGSFPPELNMIVEDIRSELRKEGAPI